MICFGQNLWRLDWMLGNRSLEDATVHEQKYTFRIN